MNAQIEPTTSGGWRVLVPVTSEEIATEKRVVVYEEVEIKRELLAETQPMQRPLEGGALG